MSTQEQSQWVEEVSKSRMDLNNLHSQHANSPSQKMSQQSQADRELNETPRARVTSQKNNYTPGDSGHIDLQLSIIQPKSQAVNVSPELIRADTFPDITPLNEHRVEQYEGQRFMPEETPIRGGFLNLPGDLSGNAEDTPLPANSFGANPFGQDHNANKGVIGLTQVFAQTQAASSPLVARRMVSSQQPPTPGLLVRQETLEAPSDILEGLSPIRESSDLTAPPETSSDIELANGNDGKTPSKRLLDAGDDNLDDPAGAVSPNKRRKTLRSDAMSAPVIQNHPKSKRNGVSRGTVSNAEIPVELSDDEVNLSEQETDREDLVEDDVDPAAADNSEGNKENQHLRDFIESPGINIKRALQQPIPGSSSPGRITPGIVRQAHISPSKLISRSSLVEAGRLEANRLEASQPIIADSQSSQQHTKAGRNVQQHVIASSNDKIIPGTQAVVRDSSRQPVSTAPKHAGLRSQQTASPPNSRAGSFKQTANFVDPLPDVEDAPALGSHPTPPRSSPPLHTEPNNGRVEIDDIEDDYLHETESQKKRRLAIGKTPARRSRQASTVPETTINSRHTSFFIGKQPVRRRDQFELAEEMDLSFNKTHHEAVSDEEVDLPAVQQSPEATSRLKPNGAISIQESPRKPIKGFAEMTGVSQEQDSFDISNISLWDTQQENIRKQLSEIEPPPSSDQPRRRPIRRAIVNSSSASREPSSMAAEPVEEEPAVVSFSPPAPAATSADGSVAEQQGIETAEQAQEESADMRQVTPSPIVDPQAAKEPSDGIPFLDSPKPAKLKNVYGRGAKAGKAKQMKPQEPMANKNKRKRSPSPHEQESDREDETPAATEPIKRRDRPSKQPRLSSTAKHVVSNKTASIRSSKRGTMNSSYATAPTSLSLATDTLMSAGSLSESTFACPNRVLAEYRGTPAGFYPATCIDCYQGEGEMKYKVRFEDGAIDDLGITKVKRLEFRAGDEVKVWDHQDRTAIFIVAGFSDKLSSEELGQMDFPTTDVYGHNTIIAIKKPTDGKTKRGRTFKDLKLNPSELYLAKNQWKAFEDREYVHVKNEAKPTQYAATPTISANPSAVNSPSSRTRSTNKTKLESTVAPNMKSTLSLSVNATAVSNGIFKNVVFVFSGLTKESFRLQESAEKQGGCALPGFELLFETHEEQDTEAVENDNERQADINVTRMPINKAFDNARLAVLIKEGVGRSHKYFQALALGIPILSPKWVKDCLRSGSFKNWRPYLLASGESDYLGTTASQQLDVRHHEIDDPSFGLTTMLSRRERWLENSRVLIVGSGADEISQGKSQAHVFIARALGASEVTTVSSQQEAESHLSNSQTSYDWVCIDNEKDKNDRQSKRRSGIGAYESLKSLTNPDKTRVVGTQCVLESLIVGSLIDMDEM